MYDILMFVGVANFEVSYDFLKFGLIDDFLKFVGDF